MNTLQIKIFGFVCILSIICIGQSSREIFIDYGIDTQGQDLFQFFNGVEDGFYVDIGAYDPVFASNTLNLRAMGWNGINIEANPDRFARFLKMRQGQTNINYAIGQQDQIMILYELAEDSSSTLSSKIKQSVKNIKPLQNQIKVPSITMKQLCERYYYRKPLFMNLDIEGYGGMVVQTNDWNNSLCVPDIIFSEIIDEMTIANFTLPEVTLTKVGYKKFPKKVGLEEIYIHESVYDKYAQRYEQNKKVMQSKTIAKIYVVTMTIGGHLSVQTSLVPHYQVQQDPIYYHFAQEREIVNLAKLNQKSNQLHQIQDRAIVILHFNPITSYILINTEKYSSSELKISDYSFYNITVYKQNGKFYSCYIFNHYHQPETKPKIVVVPLEGQGKGPQRTNIHFPVNQDERSMQQIENELKNYNNLVQRNNQNMETSMKQLMNAIIGNHQYDKSKIQAIFSRIQQLGRYQQATKGQQGGQTGVSQFETKSIMQTVQGLIRSQVLLLMVVFFGNSISCLLLFINKSEPTMREMMAESQSRLQKSQISELKE